MLMTYSVISHFPQNAQILNTEQKKLLKRLIFDNLINYAKEMRCTARGKPVSFSPQTPCK